MNQPAIGFLINHNEQRDAIHIAVLPVVATHVLQPGEHVYFPIAGNTQRVSACSPNHPKCIGIIDPFLHREVRTDEACWVFMKPNTITGLRHEWTHPLVDGEDRRAIAEFWLREFAARMPMDYDQFIYQLRDQGSIYSGNDFDYTHLDNNIEEMKQHFLTLTGIQLGDVGFRCAC